MSPQVPLSRAERKKVTLGNQYTDAYSIMKWRAMKGAAMQYEVEDWLQHIDRSLTYQENIELLRQRSTTREGGPTLNRMPISFCDSR